MVHEVKFKNLNIKTKIVDLTICVSETIRLKNSETIVPCGAVDAWRHGEQRIGYDSCGGGNITSGSEVAAAIAVVGVAQARGGRRQAHRTRWSRCRQHPYQ